MSENAKGCDASQPLTLDNLPDIIPRLPNESAQAFEALCVYAQMGPERSVLNVARKLTKSRNLINRWCSRHDWVRRVRQFDALVAAAAQASYLEAAAALAKAHAAEANEVRARALARLKDMPLDALSPAVALKCWVEAIRVERLSLGLPTDNSHTTANVAQQVNANVSVVDDSDADMVRLMVGNKEARDLARQLFDALVTGGMGEADDEDGDDRDNDTAVTLTDDELDEDTEADE